MIALLYNLFIVPFSIGLDIDIKGGYYALDVLSMIIFLGDSILRSFLAINGYYNFNLNSH
jgi:hypothetical protein